MAMPEKKLVEMYKVLSERDKELASEMIERLAYNYEPNEETIAAINDVERGIGLSKPYDNVSELMRDLDA